MTSTTRQAARSRESSVGWQIKMLAREMDNSLQNSLKPAGISVDQFKVIATLLEHDGLSQVQIAKFLQLPSYTITRLIDSLERSGFVVRNPDQCSRRNLCINLTQSGKALGPQLFDSVIAVNEQILAPLTHEETELFKKILHKLIVAQTSLT